MDIEIPDGVSEEEALKEAGELFDAYEEQCECGLCKAVDLYDERNAALILPPALVKGAAFFRLALEDNSRRLADALASAVFAPPPVQKGLLDYAPDPFGLIKALRGRPHEFKLFPLSVDRVMNLFDIAKESTRVFAYQNLGWHPADEAAQVKRWIELGLLPADFAVSADFQDAYLFSRFSDAMDAGADYTEMKRIVAGTPLTAAHEEGLDWFRANGCQHIQGLANDLAGRALSLANGQTPEDWMRSQVKEVAEAAKRARLTRGQLASELRNQTQNYGRDWDRIAATVFCNMADNGRAENIRREYGPDGLVIRIPKDTACAGCRRLYLDDNGRPRVYKLSELTANGTNADKVYMNPKTGRFVGLQPQRIAQDARGKFIMDNGGWLPVLGATHPNCGCVTVAYPAALEWASSPDLGREHWPVTIKTDREAGDQWEGIVRNLSEDILNRARKMAAERRRLA